jgi:DNA-binding transcriptional MerR regulator
MPLGTAQKHLTIGKRGFVHEAKQLGFTLKEIRDLLTLRDNPQTDAAAVRGRADVKVASSRHYCPSPIRSWSSATHAARRAPR